MGGSSSQSLEVQAQEVLDQDPCIRVNVDSSGSSTVGSASIMSTALASADESKEPPVSLQADCSSNSTQSKLASIPLGHAQSPERAGVAVLSSSNAEVLVPSERCNSATDLSCSHCQASVNAIPCPTAFQRVHELCHCCKSAIGDITRDIIHPNFTMVHLRFCFSCFERNGSEFMVHVQTMKQAVAIKCSRCHQEKLRNEFHRRQQILRPWDEMPDEKQLCLVCLPDGFERDENAIVPQRMKCVKCDFEKERIAFILSAKEQALSSTNLDLLQQWVNNAQFECDLCLFKAASLAQCLTCSSCERLLKRKKFPPSQQVIAVLEDANPGHLGHKPIYTCTGCTAIAVQQLSKHKSSLEKQANTTTDSSRIQSKKDKAHPATFPAVHQLCHCCKTAVGNIKRNIIHTDHAMVNLRFCSPCFVRNGSEFMTQVRVMKPPVVVRCSGCHQEKPRKDFHKKQQILRPWEELPDQKHICLVCLPNGFERNEDAVVPQIIKCVKCNSEKDRVAFVRSLNELAPSCTDVGQLQRWVNTSKFVCDNCMLIAAQAAQRLPCLTCKKLLSRIKFPPNQRMVAKLEDENPGQLGHKPVYKCLDCKPLTSLPELKDKDYHDNDSKVRTDSSRSLPKTDNASPHPTAFESVNEFCHCCKIAASTTKRDIIHTDFAMVRVRFCTSCFEDKGNEFMAEVRTMKPPTAMKCSGCHREKPLQDFHKRQQILRPWEELPGRKHFCLTCLPSGFECEEDAIVPQRMTCAKCDKEKDRKSFILSISEQAPSSGNLGMLRQSVKNASCVCDHCIFMAGHAAQRLVCSMCKQLLKRKKFDKEQRDMAVQEDENPGHLGRQPVYMCLDCCSATLVSPRDTHDDCLDKQVELPSGSSIKQDRLTPELKAFERVHEFCHCCKTAIGDIKRAIIHPNPLFSMVHLRFCSSCFDRRGSEFMAQVRTMKPPTMMKCSGCLQDKNVKDFHKRQQILRPWEELPDQKHFCLMCLPCGFENIEDIIVPQTLKCVKCDSMKERVAFVRSIKEQVPGSDNVDLLRQWVNDALLMCDHCLFLAGHAAQRLSCFKCKHLLNRKMFSKEQRAIAVQEDENPGHLGQKPVYICSTCSSLTLLSPQHNYENSTDEEPGLSAQEKRSNEHFTLEANPSDSCEHHVADDRDPGYGSSRHFIFDHRKRESS